MTGFQTSLSWGRDSGWAGSHGLPALFYLGENNKEESNREGIPCPLRIIMVARNIFYFSLKLGNSP